MEIKWEGVFNRGQTLNENKVCPRLVKVCPCLVWQSIRQLGVGCARFLRCGVPRLEQACVSRSRNYDTKWLGYLCRKGDFLFRGIVIDRAEEASCERRLGYAVPC